MKTILEAASEYASKDFSNKSSFEFHNQYTSFQAGAEFAQRWIPIEEELPEDNGEKLLVKMNEEVYVAYYSSKYGWNAAHLGLLKNVTHWRPIELQ